MNLELEWTIAKKYKSISQKARVTTEYWSERTLYCPVCGSATLDHYTANKPVADFLCDSCGAEYELKSKMMKKQPVEEKLRCSRIVDGAYKTMMQRITSMNNPNLFYMTYHQDLVSNLILIPRFFFTPGIIEKRRPLKQTARRAGWVGCNINLRYVPDAGKIFIVCNGAVEDRESVINKYKLVKPLAAEDMERRSWLMDILLCIEEMDSPFSLSEAYGFEDALSKRHPKNNNIRAKIRQQLQVLRDKGFLEFLGKGMYKKL